MEANRGLDLEKELTCSICTEVLYQPLTLLDCLHSFCGSCLKEWFTWQLTAVRNAPNSTLPGFSPYTCPSCRAPVRDTQHNSTLTTLLDMFLAANPSKVRSPEERDDIAKKYRQGEPVLPKVSQKDKSLRERRVDDEDRVLIDEIRTLSLRELGFTVPEARRERRRRADGSRSDRPPSGDGRRRSDRSERRRNDQDRRTDREDVAGQLVDSHVASPSSERRPRRRSAERRLEEEQVSRVRQIEHQSSIRSLIGSSDLDSREIEAEILRQIREENLLEGIDLDNIDVSQEDQISERIAEAFRRKHGERRNNPTNSDALSSSGRLRPPRPLMSDQSENPDEPRRSSRGRRSTSRSPMAAGEREPNRPPLSSSAVHSSHLSIQDGTGDRRRRRVSSRSSSLQAQTGASGTERPSSSRSQSHVPDRPQSESQESSQATRPLVLVHRRNNTDPTISTNKADDARGDAVPNMNQVADTKVPRSRKPQELLLGGSPQSGDARKHLSIDAAHAFSPQIFMTDPIEDASLYPAPLSPRYQPSISDKANAISSGSRPVSASSATLRIRPQLYPEPNVNCARCSKQHIEYELHYNCAICRNGDWNICLACYRARRGCLHWFGFGAAAWERWEALVQHGDLAATSAKPHMLTANRYIPPRVPEGGADGRRTLTTEDPKLRLQSGTFCAACSAWTNACYWRCESCNDGDWGFCNSCVDRGLTCTHPLLPLVYKPLPSDVHDEASTTPPSPGPDHRTPEHCEILSGPDVIDIGPFKPLTFRIPCNICHVIIPSLTPRFHCYKCTSTLPATEAPHEICTSCYAQLASSRRIATENGPSGWRRCLSGHRMVVLTFESRHGGERRRIQHDLVGGLGIREMPLDTSDNTTDSSTSASPTSRTPVPSAYQKWSWGDAPLVRSKLVSTDVARPLPAPPPPGASPSTSTSTAATAAAAASQLLRTDHERDFPPDGGVGLAAIATWSWYPDRGDPSGAAADELLFPKGAIVLECRNVNDDWFHGAYMGARGLFPGNYVRVVDR